jgi:hypothetical protein
MKVQTATNFFDSNCRSLLGHELIFMVAPDTMTSLHFAPRCLLDQQTKAAHSRKAAMSTPLQTYTHLMHLRNLVAYSSIPQTISLHQYHLPMQPAHVAHD